MVAWLLSYSPDTFRDQIVPAPVMREFPDIPVTTIRLRQ